MEDKKKAEQNKDALAMLLIRSKRDEDNQKMMDSIKSKMSKPKQGK